MTATADAILPAQTLGQRAATRLRRYRLRAVVVGILLAAFAAVLPIFLESAYRTRVATETLLYIGLAVSWSIFSGLSGYVSFGHAAFFGLGAYTVGIGTQRYGWPIWFAILAAPLIVGLIAMIVGLLTLRLRGHYFAIATLGIAEAIKVLVEWGRSYTKGTFGFAMPIDVIRASPDAKYYAMLASLVAVVAAGLAIVWSNYGARLLAIREDELAAESLGISPALTKISALGISGGFTGLFGGVFAWTQGFLTPEAFFASRWSLELVVMAIVGGIGTISGPILGGLVFYLVPEVLIEHKLILQKRNELYLMLLGGVLIATMLFMKRGVMGSLQNSRIWPKGFRV